VFGALGVLVTYFTHLYLTVAASAQSTPFTYTQDGSTVVTDMVASWVAAGWSYLGAFGVGFEAGGEAATLSAAPNNVAALSNSPFALATTVLFAVTVGTLVAAGYAIASHTGADSPADAAKAGLTVVPPYVVFAGIAAVLMSHTYSDPQLVSSVVNSVGGLEAEAFISQGEVTSDLQFGPSLTDAVLLAGVVFPAAFAVVGALLTQGQRSVDAVVDRVNS